MEDEQFQYMIEKLDKIIELLEYLKKNSGEFD